MVAVGIVFENGVRVYFEAQEFDVDLYNTSPGIPNTFKYKDADGNVQPIYLTPEDVSGVFVTPVDRSGDTSLKLFSAS